MRSLPRGVWHYASLMIFLLAIAALAAWTTVSYLYDNITAEEYQQVLHMVSFKVWALTMGFMCIAGAFGLWAIQFSAETESLLRMSQVVETMDYLSDGLVIADKRGRITGCNPSLQEMTSSRAVRNAFIREVFPCLSEADLELLLDIHGPNEVQRDLVIGDEGRRALRFRSQTAGGAVLILVSDITTMRQHEQRKQQMAHLELIGRIARGVADDFNDILSGIAGHAALLSRLAPGSEESKKSVATIVREAERGAHLAGHLLEFSQMSTMGKPTDNVFEHIEKARDLIRVGLHAKWTVETSVEDSLPVVSLSGLQIEQVMLNLALASADAMRGSGTIRITAGKPCQDHLMNVGDQFAVVVIMSVIESSTGTTERKASAMDDGAALEAAGVIHSVVRSLLEEAGGGTLDLFAGPDGAQIYRVVLPFATIEVSDDESDVLPDELRSYVAGWKVLLARESHAQDYVEEQLGELGVKVERVDNVMTALARIESDSEWNAIVVEKGLLGDEANGLLKAIVKLCPGTGLVVLCEDPAIESRQLSKTVQFTSRRAAPVQIVKSMVEARGLAVRPRSG